MIRWGVLAAGVSVVVGAAFVTGASQPQKPGDPPPPPPEAKAGGSKIGFFNMAKVMREYKRAENQVKDLNDQKGRMSIKLQEWRARYTQLQQDVQKATDPKEKEKMGQEMLQLARKIEDKDREINKTLNERASEIIAGLHDDIYATTAEIAKEKGLVAVFAYPDAVTKEEKASPQVKELKLKPPAAHPFYLDPSVDYTDEVVKRLNARREANGDD